MPVLGWVVEVLSQVVRGIHGLLHPEEHGGVPGVEPGDGVVGLDGLGVGLHVPRLYLGTQRFGTNLVAPYRTVNDNERKGLKVWRPSLAEVVLHRDLLLHPHQQGGEPRGEVPRSFLLPSPLLLVCSFCSSYCTFCHSCFCSYS